MAVVSNAPTQSQVKIVPVGAAVKLRRDPVEIRGLGRGRWG